LRLDYEKFRARGAEVLVIGPEDEASFRREWLANSYQFVGLADPDHSVSTLYGQQVKLLKMGRLPALVVVDPAGRIRFRHYGESMRDIVSNEAALAALDEVLAGSGPLPTENRQPA
jgi:peroxiredoxin Q/BCP